MTTHELIFSITMSIFLIGCLVLAIYDWITNTPTRKIERIKKRQDSHNKPV